ncbi:cytochrome P450 71A4-like [Lycium barbarum]|uniref:cytochrome P450 71A4-like n=1 Tax=Lycium barbarum TaxID=112863 RepID=UPI00293ED2C6|nr:cytochrome P450 71A4-like [Lycium barbarum]
MELPWYFFLVPLLVFIFFLRQWFFTTSNGQKRLIPPSPRKLPIIGNLHQLGSHPHRSLHKLSEKYGPVMLLHLGSKPVLVASSAEAARDILKIHDLVCSNRPNSSIANGLLYGSKDVAYSPYGEYWRQIRSVTVLHLLSNKRVQSYRDVREDETSNMIEKLRQGCDSSNSVINLRDLLSCMTNNIISRVAIGRTYDEGEGGIDVKALLEELLELLGIFNIGDYIPWLKWVNEINGLNTRVKKVAKDLDAFLESVIEEHIIIRNKKREYSAGEAKDFVDVLLEIQNGMETGFPLQRDSLKAILLDSFIAGTDTTYTTLEWVMTELLRNPRAMEKLQDEVRQLAQGKVEITEDDLGNMQYLKAVIKEALRLHSPVPLLVPRESMEDVKLLDYDIAAKTQIFINAWAIGRDSSSWDDPEEYRPERFLNNNIDVKGLNFELIPFGAGRRGCPAAAFAVVVIELALARLMHKFNFALPEGITKEDLDMTECTGLAIRRKSPLLAVATPDCR